MPETDALLVLTLRVEISRQGGAAKVPTLLTYCPAARPLLGDRRLLAFIREHPEVFSVATDVTSTTMLHTKGQEGKRHSNVMQTVRVLELASEEDICSAAINNQAVQTAARHVVQCVQWRLEELATSDGPKATASTCTASPQPADGEAQSASDCSAAFAHLVQHSRVKRSLLAHMRIAPALALAAATAEAQVEHGDTNEELSAAWWIVAFRALHSLLTAKPEAFHLSTEEAPETLLELRAVRVALTGEASSDALRAREGMHANLRAAICRLHKRSGEDQLSLARIGQDGAVKKAARGIPLLKAVRAALAEQQEGGSIAAADRLLQLVPQPPPTEWAVRLASSSGGCKPARQVANHGVASDSPDRTPSTLLPVDVLATGNGAAIVVKPPGVSTEAWMYSVAKAVSHEFAAGAPVPSVSRLDKNTSGAMVVPTSRTGEAVLTEQFKGRSVDKTYTALVRGMTAAHGTIEAKLHVSNDKHHFRVYVSPKGKPAVTEYRRLRLLRLSERAHCADDDSTHKNANDGPVIASEVFSLVEVKPLTGRTHQIRAHFAARGHPLVSDTKYKPKVAKRQLQWCKRLFLHATRLRVLDLDGQVLEGFAPLPDDLQEVLGQMDEVAAQPT